jgi:L,D-peptidoglycan transpeptidase YkuD (ErfK/YbiS/YcfS/YnhG family)
MDLVVSAAGIGLWGERRLRCALGRGGIGTEKHEGDGATPAGAFLMREVYYRPDRLTPFRTKLPLQPLDPADGWCDAPLDAAYNRPVTLPYGASAETLWREDGLYDLIVPLGYNDDPVVPGHGSAIFLHIARGDYAPTEGCVALSRDDLLAILAEAGPESRVVIAANP